MSAADDVRAAILEAQEARQAVTAAREALRLAESREHNALLQMRVTAEALLAESLGSKYTARVLYNALTTD
jgi:hypothetical protein